MARPFPDTGASDVGPTEDRPPSTPRWVKVFGVIGIVLILLFGILKLAGGSNHGPGRHMPSGNASDDGGKLPASFTEHRLQQL